MLLDDVMSELDPERRARLVERLAEGGGQALITATEADHAARAGERTEICDARRQRRWRPAAERAA